MGLSCYCAAKLKVGFTLVFCSVLIFGCVSTRTVNKAVTERYQNALVKSLSGANFSVANRVHKDTLVRTKKVRSQFIPALFYWKSSGTFKTNLDSYVTVNLLNKYADDYANTINFKEKLKGRTIELEVVSIPNEFEYKQTTTTLYFIIAASTMFQNQIFPGDQKLEIAYKIYKDGGSFDMGTIVVVASDLEVYREHLSVLKRSEISPKLFLKDYLNIYENQIFLMTKVFIDKLALKL